MAKMRKDHINRNDYALFVVPAPSQNLDFTRHTWQFSLDIPGSFHSTYLVVYIGVFNDLRWEIFVS